MRILGVDPGSRLAGYGCIEIAGRSISVLGYGTLKLGSGDAKNPIEEALAESVASETPRETAYEQRLVTLYEGLSAVIAHHRPQILAIEKVFFAKNASSALKLGQARGVVLLVAAQQGLEIQEYTPTEVKRAIVGHGHADKEQVAKMLRLTVSFKSHLQGKASTQPTFKTWDASDALALAVCHAHRIMNSFQSQVLMRSKRTLDVDL